MSALSEARAALRSADLVRRIGWVRRLQGLAIEAEGPEVELGEMCRILPRGTTGAPVLAEVVGLEPGRVVLLPYGALRGIAAGSQSMRWATPRACRRRRAAGPRHRRLR